MKRKSGIPISVLLLSFSYSYAQDRSCGTMENLQILQQQDAQLRQRMEAIEVFTTQWAAVNPGGDNSRAIITIPVVVHVVYNTTAENVSDAQVQSQITAMNKDFSRTNADASGTPSVWQSIAANCELQFCLATVDPNGNSTNGITRTSTSTTAFSTNNNVKFNSSGGKDAWNSSEYLNMWVCDLNGYLGYAQFPGGPATTDGVVIDYLAFGTTGTAASPFHLGRTVTHEVGHWLSLYHIWGDDGSSCSGTDNAGDTPNQAGARYGCPTFPAVSCSNGPNGDMFMNYMDYTHDNCMNLFTNGQKARMQAMFAAGGFRNVLLSSNACGSAPPPPSCATPSGLNATNVTTSSATLNWGAVSGATSYNARIKAVSSSTWSTSSTGGTSVNANGLSAGTQYEFQAQAVCGSSTGSYSSSAIFTTASSGCNDAYESNQSISAAKTIPANSSIQALISPSTDIDWFKFNNTSSQRRIKVTMTNLPFDYDMSLYNSSGTRLRVSQNGGTTSETMIYNTTRVGTYYIKVYGYNGANSPSQCYALTAQISNSSFRETAEMMEPEPQESGIGQLYPNPVNEFFMLDFFSGSDATLDLSIIDLTGRIISSWTETAAEGLNSFKIETESFLSGVYLIRVSDGERIYSKSFLVNR